MPEQNWLGDLVESTIGNGKIGKAGKHGKAGFVHMDEQMDIHPEFGDTPTLGLFCTALYGTNAVHTLISLARKTGDTLDILSMDAGPLKSNLMVKFQKHEYYQLAQLSRFPFLPLKQGEEAEQKFKQLVTAAAVFNESDRPYNLLGENCNAAASQLLDAIGLKYPPVPGGWNLGIYPPGWTFKPDEKRNFLQRTIKLLKDAPNNMELSEFLDIALPALDIKKSCFSANESDRTPMHILTMRAVDNFGRTEQQTYDQRMQQAINFLEEYDDYGPDFTGMSMGLIR